jgi:inner membrane protein
MDSLTQIVLGAAVGEVVLGKKIGNKAQLFGAIAGTIPDLDILISIFRPDDLSEIQLHRGYSHALFTHVILAFPLAFMMKRWFKKTTTFMDWYWLWFLGLATHAILDAFTTYGTRLFLPFSSNPIGFNNISVIDPAYTFPFMGLLMVCLFLKRTDPRRLKWAWRSIYVSSAYMLLTFAVKGYMHAHFSSELKRQNFTYETLKTSPTFFNNALWAGMAISDSSIVMGEYSLFQGDPNIQFYSYKRHLDMEKGYEGEALNTLKWFSQGAYLIEPSDSQSINVFIVKWGRSNYLETEPKKTVVFYYRLQKDGTEVKLKTIRPKFGKAELKMAFAQLYKRIWHKP